MNRDRERQRKEDKTRLFFGFEVQTTPKIQLPPAKIIGEKHRHITFSFLGEVDLDPLLIHLERFPAPDFARGIVGELTEVLFLPPQHPKAVAWKAAFFHKERKVRSFHQQFEDWLRVLGFTPTDPEREWLPHVTFGRAPFDENKWRENFEPHPFVATRFHLYESLGNSIYEPRWTYALVPPFVIEGDTILLRGSSLAELLLHAQVALSILYPPLWNYYHEASSLRHSLNMMTHLNKSISAARAKYSIDLHSIKVEEPPAEVQEKSLESIIKLVYQKVEES